jgi:hypothetical protein
MFARLGRITLVVAMTCATVVATSVAGHASHGTFTTSGGIYRVPYANGTEVTANNDHHTHPNAVDRVDLAAGAGSTIVAAASGTIRGIRDMNGDDFGRGDGLAADGVTANDDDAEHVCLDDADVVGDCSDYNNYVWIEHPNGEWTKYTHFQTGSVTIDNGWSVGDTIFVGQTIGNEGDVGSASGPHLHFEVAAVPPGSGTTPFSMLGGFVPNSWNVVTVVCFADGDDDGDSLYTDGESYTAAPCVNTAPTADAGGPYVVDEGSTVLLDGTGSSDPHNAVLTFTWAPATHLDDASLATPTYSGVDDTVDDLTLTVSDVGGDVTPLLALTDDDTTTVTVQNGAPRVSATGDTIDEGQEATVSATFSDPGTLDTHTATIDWGDGGVAEPVTVGALSAGVGHVYGDNGDYTVTVTVTDDDGGAGSDAVTATVGNLDPVLALDTGDAVSFPGGDHFVVHAGSELPAAADGTDPGSDDLTFSWSVGDVNTHFNDGVGPDPFPSPHGIFPFAASDSIDAVYAAPGVETLAVTLTDDDGGSDDASFGVIVTGTADDTQGLGWWKHQFSGTGSPHIDAATATGYLDIVNAVSSVFSEETTVVTPNDVHAVLSPHGADRRAKVRGDLMLAWLQFASGAVPWDATVPLNGNDSVALLDLMLEAESTVLDPTATNAQLKEAEQALARVRHAS